MMVSLPSMLNESTLLVFVKGYLQFLLGVHHDGSVPGHRFANWFSGNKEKTHTLSFRGDRHLLTIVKDHETGVANQWAPFHIEIVRPLHFVGEGVLLPAENTFSFDDIGENGVTRLGWMNELRMGRNGHVEVLRVSDNIGDRPRVPSISPQMTLMATPFPTEISGISFFVRPR